MMCELQTSVYGASGWVPYQKPEPAAQPEEKPSYWPWLLAALALLLILSSGEDKKR